MNQNKYTYQLSLLATLLCICTWIHASPISNQSLRLLFDQGKFAGLNTAAKEFYLSEDEKYVVALCNLVRFDARSFIQEVILPAGFDTSVVEMKSLLADLKRQKSLFPLMPAFSLYKSAFVHAKDMGSSGMSGHISSNGKTFQERVQQFFPNSPGLAENYYQGSGSPVEIVMDFLLEKGENGKSYRQNLLSEEVHYIGLSIQPHRTKCTNAVLDFAKKPNIAAEMSPKKKHPGEVYWKDCPPGTKISTKRKSGGFFLNNLFGGKRR
jgi:uncharacterized protein YkwD